MVVELLLKPKARNWSFPLVLFVGMFYAIIGGLGSLWLFESQLGIVMVFLTVLAGAPFMYQMIRYEEKKELSFHSQHQFLKEYAHILKALLALFIGMTIGFIIFFVSYNTYLETSATEIDVHVSYYADQSQSPNILAQETVKYLFNDEKSVKSYDYFPFRGNIETPVHIVNDHKFVEGYWWQSANTIVSLSMPKKTSGKVRDLIITKYLGLYPPSQAQYHDVSLEIDTAAYFFQEIVTSYFVTVDSAQKDIAHNRITYSLKSNVFEPQLRSLPLDLSAKEYGFGAFASILNNNIGVALISFVFAFVFGFGALFIIVWNASYFAAAVAGFLSKTLIYHSPFVASFISFFRFFTHGVFEIVAFFLMGLAGSIISFGIANHEFGTKNFLRTAGDAAQLVLIALLLLILGAWIEVWITPLIFG